MKGKSQTQLALVAAVLVGLFAIIAVNKYIAAKTAVAPTPKATILAVTQEIKEGGEIGPEMLTVREIPFDALSNIHISLPSQNDAGFAKAFEDAKAKIVGRRVKRIVAAETPLFVEVNGFKIGLLSYTYGSNAWSNREYLKDDDLWHVNFFQRQEANEPAAQAWLKDRNSSEGRAYAEMEAKRRPENLKLQWYERTEDHARERERLAADVARMRKGGPDLVVMSMHAGGQYNPEATARTKELAAFLLESGVDVIAGSHEHVVHGSDFSGFRDGRLVTYSLGNFDGLSGTWFAPHDKMAEYSVAWHVYLTREAGGKAHVGKTTFTVLRTVKGEKPNTIRVVPPADLYACERDEARKAELKAGIAEIARRFCGRDFSREPVALEHELQPSRPSVR